MYVKLHHVGIAVEDLDALTSIFKDKLGLRWDHSEDVPSEHARVSFFPVGESSLELVQPTSGETGLSRFLAKRGPGLHHICLEVEDIESLMSSLKKRGVRLTSDAPVPGAHGARVTFIHPQSTGGLLIELREGAKESHDDA